jgi:hypothetical protein
MFGYAAFAQSPYASLGSTRYAVALTEAFTSGDSQSLTAAFVSAITEALTSADVNVGIKIHNSAITEAITLAELESVVAAFVSAISEPLSVNNTQDGIIVIVVGLIENLGILDSPTAVATFVDIFVTETLSLNDNNVGIGNFASSVAEPIIVDSLPIGWGWIRIDDSETTEWVLIDNRQ